ncbi:MAG: hypothetical protein ABH824_00660 [Nanoarchaeota archaeon]|nr:hypothetical protein [Nanoarchaeota archaeon]MBU1631573.1 hypothetical protein [Nanoarchaeota archaeon]MBU1875489.1 hypothetical protein [Nanoarchaeota archaeon]
MALKNLLGLESFPIGDSEIMRRIQEAYKQNLEEIEFSSEKRVVKIKLSKVSQEGITHWYTG